METVLSRVELLEYYLKTKFPRLTWVRGDIEVDVAEDIIEEITVFYRIMGSRNKKWEVAITVGKGGEYTVKSLR